MSFGEPVSISGGMGTVGSGGTNSGTTMGGSEMAVVAMSSALLAHQLPPLPKFDGGTGSVEDGEMVREWLDQFELVAGMRRWDNQAKLVNLVTRLKEQAYSFFKLCSGNNEVPMSRWQQH